jgi:hypothetical protein
MKSNPLSETADAGAVHRQGRIRPGTTPDRGCEIAGSAYEPPATPVERVDPSATTRHRCRSSPDRPPGRGERPHAGDGWRPRQSRLRSRDRCALLRRRFRTRVVRPGAPDRRGEHFGGGASAVGAARAGARASVTATAAASVAGRRSTGRSTTDVTPSQLLTAPRRGGPVDEASLPAVHPRLAARANEQHEERQDRMRSATAAVPGVASAGPKPSTTCRAPQSCHVGSLGAGWPE